MTVYVVQRQHQKNDQGELVPKFNLSPAKKYGGLKYICPHNLNPKQTEVALEHIREAMVDFTADDHLLLIGNPVLIGLATLVAAEYSDSINFLQWSGQLRDYIEIPTEL